MKISKEGLENWQKVGIACLLIVISGLIGWLIEFFFAWFDNGMDLIYYKGGNFLPWINMYAYGVFMIFFCCYRFKDKPMRVFLVSMIVCTIFELIIGFGLDYFFGVRYWNYEKEFLDFNGYICLLSVVGFGIGGLFTMYFLIPILIKLSKKIPKKVFLTISITLCTLILCDEIYNFLITKIFDLPDAIEIYRSHGIHYIN